MGTYPTAFGRFLAVLERRVAPERQIVLVGETRPFARMLARRYDPFIELAYTAPGATQDRWPTLIDRPLPSGAESAAYVCQGRSCLPPVTDPEDLARLLDEGLS
jgi:uncharacterized protein YyaL (SSP411 family)